MANYSVDVLVDFAWNLVDHIIDEYTDDLGLGFQALTGHGAVKTCALHRRNMSELHSDARAANPWHVETQDPIGDKAQCNVDILLCLFMHDPL